MEDYILGVWYQVGRLNKHYDFLDVKSPIVWTLLRDVPSRLNVIFEYERNNTVTVINGIITIDGMVMNIFARPSTNVIQLGKYEVIYVDYTDFLIIGAIGDLFILSRRKNLSINDITKALNIIETQGYDKKNIYLA